VCFVGRLIREKGVREVLRIAACLPAVPFVVVGDGALAGEVTEASETLPNLRYLGSLAPDAVHATMSDSRVVLVPSQWSEPAGLVALEAMAAGTPVVALRRGGLAEYVADAGAGRVADSLPDLVDAVEQMHENGSAWHPCSRAARAAAHGIYSPTAHVEALERVYARAQLLARDVQADDERR
jgi:glycosyltransferase involved in cell wall biosynthesis